MDYSWPDMRVLVLFQILRRRMPSTRASDLGLRRASPPLLFRLVSIRPCTFASGPSRSCRTEVDSRAGGWGLRQGYFAPRPSLRGLRSRPPASCRVLASSHPVEGGFPNSSPSRLRLLLGAFEGSIIRRVERSLKRHPSGVRACGDILNL